jgi:hypothetical protein
VKTAVGVLLNASVNYGTDFLHRDFQVISAYFLNSFIEPVRTRLTSLEATVTMLKLSVALYPPGSWLTTTSSTVQDTNQEGILEAWTLRCGLSNWVWRAITELKDDSKSVTIEVILLLSF